MLVFYITLNRSLMLFIVLFHPGHSHIVDVVEQKLFLFGISFGIGSCFYDFRYESSCHMLTQLYV